MNEINDQSYNDSSINETSSLKSVLKVNRNETKSIISPSESMQSDTKIVDEVHVVSATKVKFAEHNTTSLLYSPQNSNYSSEALENLEDREFMRAENEDIFHNKSLTKLKSNSNATNNALVSSSSVLQDNSKKMSSNPFAVNNINNTLSPQRSQSQNKYNGFANNNNQKRKAANVFEDLKHTLTASPSPVKKSNTFGNRIPLKQ